MDLFIFLCCRIDSPKDFIEANLTWGREGSTPKFQTYFDESVSITATKSAFSIRLFSNLINTFKFNLNEQSLAHLQDPWASQIKSRFSHETSYEERHKKIMKGNYAIIGKTVNGAYFPENYINSSDLKVIKIFNAFVGFVLIINNICYRYQDYRLMKQPTASFYTTFAVQPWLINSFNKVKKATNMKEILPISQKINPLRPMGRPVDIAKK